MKDVIDTIKVFAYEFDLKHGRKASIGCPYKNDLLEYSNLVKEERLFEASLIYWRLKRLGVNNKVLSAMIDIKHKHEQKRIADFIDYLITSEHKELFDNFNTWFPKARVILHHVDLRKELNVSESLFASWCKGKGAPPAVKSLANQVAGIIDYNNWR